MDLTKLMIGQFENIVFKNFQDRETKETDVVEVLIYLLNSEEDIKLCVEYSRTLNFSKDNRVVLVYRKGQKALKRDDIIEPFKDGTYLDFVMKAPVLCSLDKHYSAFVFMKE